MSTITLNDIRSAAEKKYSDLVVDLGDSTVTLRNALKLSKDERAQLKATQDEMGAEDSDEQALLEQALCIVAKGDQGKHLVAAIDGDLTVLAQTFNAYAEGTDAGEASRSES